MHHREHKVKQGEKYTQRIHDSAKYNEMVNNPPSEKSKERFHRKPYTQMHRHQDSGGGTK